MQTSRTRDSNRIPIQCVEIFVRGGWVSGCTLFAYVHVIDSNMKASRMAIFAGTTRLQVCVSTRARDCVADSLCGRAKAGEDSTP